MKNLIFITATSLFLFSCGQKEVKSVNEPVAEVSEEVSVDPSMSNPELFLGSGVGPAFMSFVKTQNFEIALQFTSKVSIDKHGREVILDKYKSLKTNYTLKKVSTSKNSAETILRYTTNEFATSKFKDFVVVVENDSCKILLPDNLEEFLK
jgi:hypothetical protein